MPKFKKGDPKPPNSGRKKGVPNKKTQLLRERLKSHQCDFEEHLAKAILAKDTEMIKVLTAMLPYLQPRLKEQEVKEEAETHPDSSPVAKTTATLLDVIHGSKREQESSQRPRLPEQPPGPDGEGARGTASGT